MMSDATTFKFEDIIPDYETFKGYISQFGIVNYNDNMEANFDIYCYNILSKFFHGQNVRYTTPNDFIFSLALVYQNKFSDFMKQKELIDKMHKLTDDDIVYLNQTLSNVANNPNDEPQDATKPLNFISGQTFQTIKGNKFNAYLNALNNMPTLNIFNFIHCKNCDEMGFTDLFMNVQPNNIYLYERG